MHERPLTQLTTKNHSPEKNLNKYIHCDLGTYEVIKLSSITGMCFIYSLKYCWQKKLSKNEKIENIFNVVHAYN